MLTMVWIGFAGLILVFRMRRNFERVAELRVSWMGPDAVVADRRKPSDDFHDQTWLPLCDRVTQAATVALSRPLAATERRSIWRSRSQLILETVLNELKSAESPEAAAALLASLPPGMDRPDPTNWMRGDV